MKGLRDVPLDLLQETSAALGRYIQARRKARLHQEQTRLQEELADMRTDLAEIQALAGTGWDEEETDHA